MAIEVVPFLALDIRIVALSFIVLQITRLGSLEKFSNLFGRNTAVRVGLQLDRVRNRRGSLRGRFGLIRYGRLPQHKRTQPEQRECQAHRGEMHKICTKET